MKLKRKILFLRHRGDHWKWAKYSPDTRNQHLSHAHTLFLSIELLCCCWHIERKLFHTFMYARSLTFDTHLCIYTYPNQTRSLTLLHNSTPYRVRIIAYIFIFFQCYYFPLKLLNYDVVICNLFRATVTFFSLPLSSLRKSHSGIKIFSSAKKLNEEK